MNEYFKFAKHHKVEQAHFNKSIVETFEKVSVALSDLISAINNMQSQVDILKSKVEELKE